MLSVPFLAWEIAVIVGVSLLICVLSTALAMESAALFVPAFVLFFPAVLPGISTISVNEAIGITLIIMFFGQTSANVGYWLRGQIDFSLSGRVLIWTIPLAIVGRISSYALSDTLLLFVFAGLLFGLSGVIYWHVYIAQVPDHPSRERGMLGGDIQSGTRLSLLASDRLAMSLGGGVTGLVGLGTGEISNTVLTARKGMPVHRSIGTSTLILYLTVLSATITNLIVVRFGGAIGMEPAIPWAIAAIVAPTVLVGGQIGPYLNSMLPERVIGRILIVLYIVVAVVTVIRALG